ncbi:hypothetical protein BpHYR1_026965 [Brachionus plicatilis]|uniref:Uncharacterized protein n=1 Tax=Brachionus plicatilis TaxID=10195 RepID=A0A3M7QHF9_BRAPC|nr:hypothetical protein BpHYR1_026965 [Brachionus plicatilis]
MEKGFKKLSLNEETNSSPIRLRSRKIPRDLKVIKKKSGSASSGRSGSNYLCSVAVNENLCSVAVNDNLCSVAGSENNINPQKIQADFVSVEVKDRAEKSREKLRTIITDSPLKVPLEAASFVPTINNLTQKINRQRKNIYNFSINEDSLKNILIKDELK